MKNAKPGYFGKIPNKADFIQNGLSAKMIQTWDTWLSSSIHESQAALGDGWLNEYLSSPVWRFSIDPGVLSDTGWLGVLASSVDSVNRTYPLMLAVPFPSESDALDVAESQAIWIEQIEQVGIQLIDGAVDLDGVVTALDMISVRLLSELATSDKRFTWRDKYGVTKSWLVLGEGFAPISAMRTVALGGIGSRREPIGRTYWWHSGWGDRAPAALQSLGLPQSKSFAAFLDGKWELHDWHQNEPAVGPGGGT